MKNPLKAPEVVGRWVAKDRWRLYLLFLVLLLLPIALFAYSIGELVEKRIEGHTATETQQIARVSATLVEEHFRQSTAFLESIAERPSLILAWKSHDLYFVAQQLQMASVLRPDFAFLSIFDLDGTMRAIYPPQPNLLGDNFAYRDWYKGVVRQWEPYVSEVYQSKVPPFDLVVAISVPVRDENGKPIAILMAAYSLDSISRRLVPANLDGAWAISLADRNGHLSARAHLGANTPLVDLSGYPPVKAALSGASGAGTFKRDGSEFFAGYEPVREYGWAVLVERPQAITEQSVWVIEQRVWLLGLVFLVVGLGLSTFMGSLYSELDTGNRFLNLSVDMFCTAGFDGFFKSLNPSWEKVLGFTTTELLARPYLEFIHPEDRPATIAEAGKLQSGEITIAFENRYQCKNGSYRWLLWNAVCVPEQQRIYAVARDITQLKSSLQQIEEKNRELDLRNREVERATQLKSNFLATMSHELRTPLNAIVGFSDLLADGTAGTLNDKQNRFVNHIKQGSAHLLRLINDILDLSKIEAGQLEFHTEDILIGDALLEVLSTIRPLAMAKNIQLQEPMNANYTLHADRVRFKQILYNLLSNAVKFTPRDGRIEMACFPEGEQVCISVTDTGIGIRREEQQAVFEEFRQAETNQGSHQEGTGLGLAITKRLVERQGGRVWLKSEPGKGSCFTFSLPVGSVSQEAKLPANLQNAAVIATGPDRPLLLVVDDEPAARELLASYLGVEYRMAMADSGASAVEKAMQLRPDAITLDVLMTGGSGFETLVELRRTPETAHIPIIIVSIVDQKQVGFALGASDYLIKPIRKSLLLETIRKHVRSPMDDDSAILIVDDDPKTLELLEETLRSAGYEVQSVRSGARALEVLSSKFVGAVLLDLLMPGIDGFEVIRHVRQQPTLKNLPVLVMTAKTLSAEELAVLNRDTQALLHKSGSWHQELLVEVGRVLQSRRQAKAAGQS